MTLVFLTSASAAQAAPRYLFQETSTTEILFALGLDEEVVGVSSYCKYPGKAKEKARVGDFSRPNIEAIVALRPDYVFCTGLEQAPVVLALQRLKMPVYVADPQTIDELFASIRDIGAITGKSANAAALIERMRREIEEVRVKTKAIAPGMRVRVYVEIWHEPLITAGKGSFVDELIALAGGVNIGSSLPRPYSAVSPETVIRGNPGCIILAYMDEKMPLEVVRARFGWDTIDAVKNKRVYNDIDPDTLLRPGPRITEGLKALYHTLYP